MKGLSLYQKSSLVFSRRASLLVPTAQKPAAAMMGCKILGLRPSIAASNANRIGLILRAA
uniref:Uncharacterized protein n=1 Tax=Manihot esculenta TaxID=3983 RepID=A0A2C9U4C3_MANES